MRQVQDYPRSDTSTCTVSTGHPERVQEYSEAQYKIGQRMVQDDQYYTLYLSTGHRVGRA
eukprot:3890999-Rhodomonas_salina.1